MTGYVTIISKARPATGGFLLFDILRPLYRSRLSTLPYIYIAVYYAYYKLREPNAQIEMQAVRTLLVSEIEQEARHVRQSRVPIPLLE